MPTLPLSQTRARRLRTLHSRKEREESGLFLAEGIRVVEELLSSAIVIDSVVTAPSLEDIPRGRVLLDRVPEQVPIYTTSEAGLAQLAGTESPQGIVVAARIPGNELPAELADGSLVLVLDGVQDPGNFGTLVRGADAFGVAAVIGLPGTVDFWNGKAVRAAAGASFRTPLVRCGVAELAQWAERQSVTVWGAAAGGEDVASAGRPRRLALVLGNEGAGLGEAVGALVGRRVGVPIRGAAESLNVAMAGTVLMYLLTRATS